MSSPTTTKEHNDGKQTFARGHKLIVVVGTTGKQGGSVARVFASEPGWKVRGITRDKSSSSSQALTALGVEMATADLYNPSTLEVAFLGATAIFAATDFWAPFYDPCTQALLKEGQTLGQYCYERELRQLKNVADAASKIGTLERIVISSLVDAGKLSGGKYTGVYHWDSKARGVVCLQEQYPELATKLSTVLIGNYMENWRYLPSLRKQADGAYSLSLCGDGHTPIPHFNAEKDTGAVVRAAILSQPRKAILTMGSMLSWSDQLKLWCEHNKVPFGGFNQLPIHVFNKLLPIPGLGQEVGEMMEFMHEFGYAGSEKVILPSDLDVPCQLTTWEDFLKTEDWQHILNTQDDGVAMM